MTFNENIPIRLYGAVPDSIVDGPGLRYAVFVQGCSHGCPGCHNPESQPADGGTLTTTVAVLNDIHANGLVHDVTFSGGEPFEQAAACAHLARQLKAEGYGIWAYTGYLYEDLARRAGLLVNAGDVAQGARCGEAVEPAAIAKAAEAERPTGAGPSAEAERPSGTKSSAEAERPTGAGPSTEAEELKEIAEADPDQAICDFLSCIDVLVDGPFVEKLKSLGLKWCGSSNQRLIDVPASRAAGRVIIWEPPNFVPPKPASW